MKRNSDRYADKSWSQEALEQAKILVEYLQLGGDDARFVRAHATAILQMAELDFDRYSFEERTYLD